MAPSQVSAGSNQLMNSAPLGLHVSNSSIAAAGEKTVYGRDVAVETFLHALMTQGSPGRYKLFYTRDSITGESSACAMLNRLAAQNSRRQFEICDIKEFRNLNEFAFRAWHDPDADLNSAVKFRALYSQQLYPITATCHILSYQGLLAGWFLQLLLRGIQPCDSIVCPSRAARIAVHKLFQHVSHSLKEAHGIHLEFKGDISMIPYSVNTDVFCPQNKAAVRSELQLPQDAFLIAWIGRISPVDKADLLPLLRVFQWLLRDNPAGDLLLLIAGSGEKRFIDLIRTYAADIGIAGRILIKEPLPVDQRHLFHAAADVFVSPIDNIQEVGGITPIEALASGVPQVVADWNSYRETVQHGETGFVIPTYWAHMDRDMPDLEGVYDDYNLLDHFALAQSVAVDLGAMKRAIEQLWRNPDLRARFAQASRNRALARHSEAVVIRQFEELWSNLSQVAAQLPYKKSARRFDQPAFVDNFGHYATEVLDGGATIRLTSDGQRLLAAEEKFPPILDLFPSLSKELLLEVLQRVAESGSGIAVDRIQLDMGGRGTYLLRHIMWLLKYHWLTLGNEPAA